MGKRKPDTQRVRVRANGRPKKGNEPDWDLFLERVRELPSIRQACAAAGVSRQAADERREKHPDFARAWDEAKEDGVDRIEEVAMLGARGRWQQEKGFENADPPSPELIKMLLRAHRPALYGINVKIQGDLSLANLRALYSTAEGRAALLEMGKRAGIIPEE